MAPLDASILFYRGIAMPHARYWQIVLKKSEATREEMPTVEQHSATRAFLESGFLITSVAK